MCLCVNTENVCVCMCFRRAVPICLIVGVNKAYVRLHVLRIIYRRFRIRCESRTRCGLFGGWCSWIRPDTPLYESCLLPAWGATSSDTMSVVWDSLTFAQNIQTSWENVHISMKIYGFVELKKRIYFSMIQITLPIWQISTHEFSLIITILHIKCWMSI